MKVKFRFRRNFAGSSEMRIRLLALDCDGVLTDGHVWFSEQGNQVFKRYSFQDIMGLNLAQRAGVRIALISGEPIPKNLMKKLDIRKKYRTVKNSPFFRQNIKNKAAELQQIMKNCSVRSKETIYVGDDVNDIDAIRLAGFGVSVKNAPKRVRQIAKMITQANGGSGAVREIIEKLILNNKKV